MQKRWAIGLVAAAALIMALVFLLFPKTAADSVTIDEAQAAVEQLYGGEVAKASESEQYYQIEFIRADGRYIAAVNRANGQVASLQQLESAGPDKQWTEEQAVEAARSEEQGDLENVQYIEGENRYQVELKSDAEQITLSVSAEDGTISDVRKKPLDTAAEDSQSPSGTDDEPERLISQQAAIAIAKETLDGVVDDVDFVQTTDGGYYLVEIEDDATDREVTVQIHAIRGETMTITWDD